jgi:hypothetical protein
LSIFNSTGAKITVDLNVTSGMSYDKFGRVLLRHNAKLFRKENLLAYSSFGESCSHFRTCLECIGDSSCLWYNAKSTCAPRRDWSPSSNSNGSNPNPMSLVLEDCSVCSDFTSCPSCTSEGVDCEWIEEDGTCGRGGKSGSSSSLRDPAQCPPACSSRLSCASCLDPPGACVWCAQTQECFLFSAYTSFFQYGQCGQWKDKESQCHDCSTQTTCENCVEYMGCGWSFGGAGGSCGNGDFGGPYETLTSQEGSNRSWTYHNCPDIDECALGLHECHPQAACVNTPGSYTCQCKRMHISILIQNLNVFRN